VALAFLVSACDSMVLPIHLCIVFCSQAENDAQKKIKYRSAEG
jgi:hypothetical protein